MTGRYLIYTPRQSWQDAKRFDANWHKFVTLCRSLDRDGLSYNVQFNLTGETPHMLITASGTAKPRKHSATRAFTLPPQIPAHRCRERVLEVAWFLPENRDRRNNDTAYWRKRYARYQELAGMAEEQLRAELEYWRELELLSGQREHFKPGPTDAIEHVDDEVAA
jgi:hypothetical protein